MRANFTGVGNMMMRGCPTSLARLIGSLVWNRGFSTSAVLVRGSSREREEFERYQSAAKGVPEHFAQDRGQQQHEVGEGVGTHFKRKAEKTPPDRQPSHHMRHPIWSAEEVSGVEVTHRRPENFTDRAALCTVATLRTVFDKASGYDASKGFQCITEDRILARCILLETIAGVPGFAAAMIRHLNSLRRMKKDHGWIHTLLGEAENERMHLMTFIALRKPGILLRSLVILAQYLFTSWFLLAYLISPRYCHRFVGYLEEQAVITYTHVLDAIDGGALPEWRDRPAPETAATYWKLPEDSTMRDVVLAIRADEAHHRHVNHTLGSLQQLTDDNPFKAGGGREKELKAKESMK